MANAAISTYTINKIKKLEDNRRIVNATLTLGTGTDYPVGGVPVAKGSLGCGTVVDTFIVEDQVATGYVYSYDHTNEKLRMFQTATVPVGGSTTAPLAELTGAGSVVASQVLKITVIGY